jgi:hypothetical protein
MRDAMWARLGLDRDEWRDCRTAAREMSLATGTRVPPQVVAIEYAMARALDAGGEMQAAMEPPRARRPRATQLR